MTVDARLSMPTFVAGPENEGRGYGVLAQSGPPIRAGWTVDLPMMLFEWAKLERQQPFAACLPMSDDLLVICRGRFFRRLAIGHDSYLNGALITTEQCARIGWRTELVAAHVPLPDETLDFARQPLTIAIPPPQREPSARWPGLGLAWANRIIAVAPPRDLEEVIQLALGSIDPPEQRRRVIGWTTSIELAPRGALNPVRQSQLVAIGGAAPDVEGFLPVTMHVDGTWDGPRIEPPEGRELWSRLHQALVEWSPALEGEALLQWSPEMSDLSATEVAAILLRGAAQRMEPLPAIGLLANLIVRGEKPLHEPGIVLLEEQLAKLARTQPAEALHAVADLRGLLAAPGRDPIALRVLMAFDAAAFDAAPEPVLATLLELAGTLVGAAGGNRGALRPLAEIALAYADRFDPSDPALFALVTLVERWPATAADMLDHLASTRLIEAVAARARASLAAITKKLLRMPAVPRDRYPARTQAEWVRALRATLAAIRHLENAHDGRPTRPQHAPAQYIADLEAGPD